MNSFLLTIHIAGGSIGVLTGLTSLFLKKGSPIHGKVGNLFAISMLFMASTGAYMALSPISMTSFLAGSVTFYMVATAWRTGRNREGKSGIPEVLWLFYILLISIAGIVSCWELTNGRGAPIGGGVDEGLDFFLFFFQMFYTFCLTKATLFLPRLE